MGLAHRGRPVTPARVALDSRRLVDFRRGLSHGGWFFASFWRDLPCFGRGFNHRWQFPLGLFCSAMMAMVQRLDARGFFFHPQLSVTTFLALVFQVCRNCFSCHSESVAEPAASKLSNLALCQRSAIRGLVDVEVLAKFRGYEHS